MKIDITNPDAMPVGRIDTKKVDSTTEADIATNEAEDDASAMADVASLAQLAQPKPC